MHALERFQAVVDSLECGCEDGYVCTVHSDRRLARAALAAINDESASDEYPVEEDVARVLTLIDEAKDAFRGADRIAEKLDIILEGRCLGDFCCDCDELIAEIEEIIENKKEQ